MHIERLLPHPTRVSIFHHLEQRPIFPPFFHNSTHNLYVKFPWNCAKFHQAYYWKGWWREKLPGTIYKRIIIVIWWYKSVSTPRPYLHNLKIIQVCKGCKTVKAVFKSHKYEFLTMAEGEVTKEFIIMTFIMVIANEICQFNCWLHKMKTVHAHSALVPFIAHHF